MLVIDLTVDGFLLSMCFEMQRFSFANQLNVDPFLHLFTIRLQYEPYTFHARLILPAPFVICNSQS